MGEARYLLGVEIFRNRSKKLLGLSQEAYINKILERFQMHYSKPVNELKQINALKQIKKERMSNVPYTSAIWSLMYAMLCTRPDIYFAISLVSRY